jgi:hypothetical protein
MKSLRHLAFIPVVLATLPFAQPAAAKCAARAVANADGRTRTILAVVPDQGSKDLEVAGYADASCGNLDKKAYLERVCNPKTWGNSGVQRQFAIQAGISPAQLCSAARSEAGLPDLTSDEKAQHFLPPGHRRSATAASGRGTPPGSAAQGSMAGPPGSVSAGVGQRGGQ